MVEVGGGGGGGGRLNQKHACAFSPLMIHSIHLLNSENRLNLNELHTHA